MKPLHLANSLATACGLFWAACSVLIWVAPAFSLYLTKLSLMGLQGLALTGFSLSIGVFVAGLVMVVVTAWLFGYVWGWFYQKFSK